MYKKSKDFYVWTVEECIKDTYEGWGIDIMPMYGDIQESFPNAAQVIRQMYYDFDAEDYFFAKPLAFKHVHYVFQAIANLIPLKKTLKFDIKTKEQSKRYKGLNIDSWNKFVRINRMNLLMAILLFTEEFIYYPVTMGNVIYTENKLIIYGEHLTFKISKHKDKTYVSIRVRGVMLLQYILLN